MMKEFDAIAAARGAMKDFMRWTGRFPAMFSNRLFISSGTLGVVVLAILQSIFFLIAAGLVRQYAHARVPSSALAALTIFIFLLWFTSDNLAEVAFWRTGQIQYFWGSVIGAYCISPVIAYTIWWRRCESGLFAKFIFGFSCFAGGLWLAQLSMGIATTWALLLVYARFSQKRHVLQILWIGLALWLLGSAILIAAPGNYIRADIIGDKYELIDKIIIISVRFIDQLDRKLLLVGVLFLAIHSLVRSHDLPQKVTQAAVFFLVAFVSAISTAGAPNVMFNGRVAFPTEFFLIVGTMSLFPSHLFVAHPPKKSINKISKLVLVFGAVLSLSVTSVDAQRVLSSYRSIKDQDNKRGTIVTKQKNLGVEVVEIPPLYFDTRTHTGNGEVNVGRRFARDITSLVHRWENQCFAKAHGIKKVRLR